MCLKCPVELRMDRNRNQHENQTKPRQKQQQQQTLMFSLGLTTKKIFFMFSHSSQVSRIAEVRTFLAKWASKCVLWCGWEVKGYKRFLKWWIFFFYQEHSPVKSAHWKCTFYKCPEGRRSVSISTYVHDDSIAFLCLSPDIYSFIYLKILNTYIVVLLF